MKSFFETLGKEFKLIARNGISLYMSVAPAILAIVFILVFGAVSKITLTLAAGPGMPETDISRLERIADIERFENAQELEARVRGTDDIAGIDILDGRPTLIFEGNEADEYASSVEELVGLALSRDISPYRSEAVEARGNLSYIVSMVSVLLLSLFIGGATVGLSIVSERESRVISALAVSPQTFSRYVSSKLACALTLSMAGIAAAAIIMGLSPLMPSFLLLAFCSVLTAGMIIFITGAFASNQIAAIGVLKLIMPLSLVLPISAIFVPDTLQFIYYAFPMYWQYAAIDSIRQGQSALVPSLLTLAVSLPWFAIILRVFAKKVKMRIWR